MYLQNSSSRFRSITDMKVHLLEEFGDDLPGTIEFDVGYYEKRSTKCLISTNEDLNLMYDAFKSGLLWCDGDNDANSSSEKSRKRKRD